MGLDITAYKGIRKVHVHFDADGEPINPEDGLPLDGQYLKVFVNPDFPESANDLEDKGIYLFDDAESLFSSGYSTYIHFRDWLAKIAGYPLGQYEQYGQKWDSHCIACWEGAKGPFSELINFSDCEGTLGFDVCKKLAQDFRDYDAEARKEERWYGYYEQMKECFEFACDNGCVDFH